MNLQGFTALQGFLWPKLSPFKAIDGIRKSGAKFTTLKFVSNLRMAQKASVCYWQAIPAMRNVNLKLIGPICKF
jgi:hypothetical protein